MCILVIMFIISIILIIYLYLIWNFKYWKIRDIQGPKPIPYFGTFKESAFFRKHVLYDLDTIYKRYKSIPFCGIFYGRTPQVLALNRHFITDILIKQFKVFQLNQFSNLICTYTINKRTDPLFSRNPFMLNGDEWKEKRSEITSGLTMNKIRSMFPIIETVCQNMIGFLKDEFNNSGKNRLNEISAKKITEMYTIDIISNFVYGLDSKSFSNDNPSVLYKMGVKIFQQSRIYQIHSILNGAFPILANIFPIPFITSEIMNDFKELLMYAIDLRNKQQYSINKRQQRSEDFLNHLINLKEMKNLSDIDITAHSFTFFIDAFETTSGVLAHVLYLLGNNKSVQEKLRKEINHDISKYGHLTFDKLIELSYLDQVFNETLRLYPPSAYISKICTETYLYKDPIDDKQFQIDKNMIVVIPIYSIHRDSQYYENPNDFIPERFNRELGGLKKYKEQGVWLPFGDGPRICLGMKFGIAQSKAFIVEIIRNFKISINCRTKEPLTATPMKLLLEPIKGIWLDFELYGN